MSEKKISRIKKLIILIVSIVIPLAVGAFSALLMPNMKALYGTLKKPWFSPPGFVFPIAWTILYILMGIAAYLVYIKKCEGIDVSSAIFVYSIQLILNLLWSFLFFGFQLYGLSFIELVILFIFVLVTCKRFYRKAGKRPALLLLPYVLWLIYAGVLNYFIWMMNEM